MLDNVVEQLATRHILHDHEDVCRRHHDLVQPDDVRMTEPIQVQDLAPNLVHHVQRLDLAAVHDLHGNAMTTRVRSDCNY